MTHPSSFRYAALPLEVPGKLMNNNIVDTYVKRTLLLLLLLLLRVL